MDICQFSGEIVFRTPYSDRFDLVQLFRGIRKGNLSFNCPVSFHTAGLQHKGHMDLWHLDVVLSFATDECVPQRVNGDFIGGNHGFHCTVRVQLPGHDKSLADVGSVWTDEAGLGWTLLRVEDADHLLFISENIGTSETEFAFAKQISGKLTYVSHGAHTSDICPADQQGNVQLHAANRYLCREVYAYRGRQRFLMRDSAEDVDCGEIVEEYEIINPATVAQALRDARPQDGYPYEPDLAVGKGMLRCSTVYRVLGDGTVLVIFDHKRLQDVRWSSNMGLMYQEKNDVGLGGVWRVIPALKPLERDGKIFDFSLPYNTTGGEFPYEYKLTPDTWENPAFPPNHQLDFIRQSAGGCLAAFAGGYLPVYDGEPSVRAANIDAAAQLVITRKTYPIFAGTFGGDQALIDRSKGVGYRRYFLPQQNGCCTNVYPFEGRDYVVMDFYADQAQTQTYPLSKGSRCRIVSKTNVELCIKDDAVVCSGSRGTALLVIEA